MFDIATLKPQGNEDGITVIWAARNRNFDVVKVILESKSCNSETLNQQDEYGNTALIWAARNGHLNIAEAILASPHCTVETLSHQNKYGDTALIWAKRGGHTAIVDAIKRNQKFYTVVANAKIKQNDTLKIAIIKFLESYAHPPLFKLCHRHHKSEANSMANSLQQLQQPTAEEIKSCVNSIASGSHKNPGGTFAGVLEKIYTMCEEAQREEVASMSPRMG